jgi:hypothetical protein
MLMKLQLFIPLLFTCLMRLPLTAQPKPYGPLPTGRQVASQDREFYLFAHFGPNTFTGLEWGKGTEKEAVFNPTALDCDQWCRIAKAAGAAGIIITANIQRIPSPKAPGETGRETCCGNFPAPAGDMA